MVARVAKDGSVFVPEQRLTRAEALRAYTLNNAYASFTERELGSLTPGKYADVTVLSKDIMRIPEAEIPSAQRGLHDRRRQGPVRAGGDALSPLALKLL